jgi:hypothetical protein
MRKIILFNQTDNLYQHFKSLKSDQYTTKIICPSPVHSDVLRSKLGSHSADFQVLTIAKFVKDELVELLDEEILQNFKGKAELKLLMASIYKRLMPEHNYDAFDLSFNLLTDLRSFSVNEDVLESILDQYNLDIKKSVLGMHKVLEQLAVFDEHKSYFTLAEKLRAGDLPIDYPVEKRVVFYGFDFLAPSQVDLLKAYAIRDEVLIPVFEEVYNAKTNMDWISWLGEDEVVTIDGPQDLKELDIALYPKNYLSKVLNYKIKGDSEVVLGEKSLDIEHVLQSSVNKTSAKVKTDFLQEELNYYLNLFKEKEAWSQFEYESLLKSQTEECIKNEKFSHLKLIQLINQAFNDFKELHDEETLVDSFFLKIIFEVVELNLPRVNVITDNHQAKINLYSLSDIEMVDFSKDIYLCITSESNGLNSKVTPYIEGVEEYLANLGPLRSSDLEIKLATSKVKNFLLKGNIKILLESGFLKESLEWSSLIDYKEKEEDFILLPATKKSDYFEWPKLTHPLESLRKSASRLQTYIDCPKRYRFQYIEKLSPRYDYDEKLTKMELGNIEHNVIEAYVNKFDQYSYADHINVIQAEIKKILKNRELTHLSLVEVENEVITLTRTCIEYLCKIKSLGQYKIRFEVNLNEFSEENISGRIDCLIIGEDETIILDFKRGSGSIPAKIEVAEFSKIQLWFYLHYTPLLSKITYGYINLSEIDKSQVYSTETNQNIISEVFAIKVHEAKAFEETLEAYKKFELNLEEKILNDLTFLPNPRNDKACLFCDLSLVCSKGVRS